MDDARLYCGGVVKAFPPVAVSWGGAGLLLSVVMFVITASTASGPYHESGPTMIEVENRKKSCWRKLYGCGGLAFCTSRASLQGQTAEMILLVQAAIIPHLSLLWMELHHRP